MPFVSTGLDEGMRSDGERHRMIGHSRFTLMISILASSLLRSSTPASGMNRYYRKEPGYALKLGEGVE